MPVPITMDQVNTRLWPNLFGKSTKHVKVEKSADKSNAVKNHNFIVATFDLQALSLLYTPLAGDNQIYYKRKLAVYNFTVQES